MYDHRKQKMCDFHTEHKSTTSRQSKKVREHRKQESTSSIQSEKVRLHTEQNSTTPERARKYVLLRDKFDQNKEESLTEVHFSLSVSFLSPCLTKTYGREQ